MKRRTFFSLAGSTCLYNFLPVQHLLATDYLLPSGVEHQEPHIKWAENLLTSMMPAGRNYKEMAMDYTKPVGPVKCESYDKGWRLLYQNRFKTNIEIRVLDGKRKLFFRAES